MTSRRPQSVHAGISVREILTRYPAAESVFEHHGLLGCGGPNGPREPVGFFARVHRVDPDQLIRELNEFLANRGSDDSPSVRSAPSPAVFPIFLITSLTIAILAGFTTGIVALAMASLGWNVAGVNWLLLVQTHGRLQLFGWAGLFVFGVAYHVTPRFVTTPISFPRLAHASYWLAVIGLALGVAQMFDSGSIQIYHALFTVGLVLLLFAAIAFAVVIWSTVLTSEQTITLPILFVLSATFWLILGLVLEVAVGAASVPAEPIQPSVEEPALEAILEGFLVVTALGVSLRTLPVFAGLASTRDWAIRGVLAVIEVGLVALVGGAALAGDLNVVRIGQIIASVGAVAFFGAALVFTWALRTFAPANLPVVEMGTGRGWARAVRLAYAWLLVGLGLQAVASVRAALTGAPIPWGTLGAARHALALGFITLMIVGMASRVIPVFAGKPLWKAWLVDLATALLGVSVLVRVPIDVFAPYGSFALTDGLLAATGPLALAGLIAFAVNFSVTMVRREPISIASGRPATVLARPLRADDLLAAALRFPDGLRMLLGLGFGYLADPAHRAVAARSLTIAQAARRADLDPDAVLNSLNQSLGLTQSDRDAVDPDQTVGDVLRRWPSTLEVFLRRGFTPLADPAIRERMAGTITVREAAASRNVDVTDLIVELGAAARGEFPLEEANS